MKGKNRGQQKVNGWEVLRNGGIAGNGIDNFAESSCSSTQFGLLKSINTQLKDFHQRSSVQSTLDVFYAPTVRMTRTRSEVCSDRKKSRTRWFHRPMILFFCKNRSTFTKNAHWSWVGHANGFTGLRIFAEWEVVKAAIVDDVHLFLNNLQHLFN